MNPRFIILAQRRATPEASERDMIELARLIDKDAWQLEKPADGYTRRLKSIEAAGRILVHQDAARSAMLPEPEPRVSGWWDRLAERMFAGKREMAR